MDRKVLTLEEIINLDRRPTLQEMVDLASNSIEDYTKFLFDKGVIQYIPESGSVYNYKDIPDEDGICHYVTDWDPVLTLLDEEYDYDSSETPDVLDCDIIDKYNINESLNGDKDKVFNILYVKNKKYKYFLDEELCVYKVQQI